MKCTKEKQTILSYAEIGLVIRILSVIGQWCVDKGYTKLVHDINDIIRTLGGIKIDDK